MIYKYILGPSPTVFLILYAPGPGLFSGGFLFGFPPNEYSGFLVLTPF